MPKKKVSKKVGKRVTRGSGNADLPAGLFLNKDSKMDYRGNPPASHKKWVAKARKDGEYTHAFSSKKHGPVAIKFVDTDKGLKLSVTDKNQTAHYPDEKESRCTIFLLLREVIALYK
jgi:hypothetical protein